MNLRRLGTTKLTVKPGQIGTSNATKAENLGQFEYAHLRAPLPEDLRGSEIFGSKNKAPPETYFLMVGQTYSYGIINADLGLEEEQRRLRQRDRHVQDRIPLGSYRR